MLSSDMAAKPSRAPRARKTGAPKAEPQVVPDGFYRDMVWNLRNGVVAVTRDGRVAVMNDIAYRILGLKPRAKDISRTPRTCCAWSRAPSTCRTCPTAPRCA
jgi:PAS domain-containing protein